MWKSVTLIVLCIVQCQSQTQFDIQIATKLATIESDRVGVTVSMNTNPASVALVQNTMTSLSANLPLAVINERVGTTLSTIEAIGDVLKGTNEAMCFQNLATVKTRTMDDVRQSINNCVRDVTGSLTTQTNTVTASLNTFNALAATTKISVATCGTNRLYRMNNRLFTLCLNTATANYNQQLLIMQQSVTDLTAKRAKIAEDLAVCTGQIVNKADVYVESYKQFIKNCIAAAPDSQTYIEALPANSAANPTIFSTQLTVGTSTSITWASTKANTQTNIDNVRADITKAIADKSVTLADIKVKLDKSMSVYTQRFAEAAAAYDTNTQATTCVNNIKLAMPNNINKQSTEYFNCLQSLRTATLATDLAQIDSLFSQRQAKEAVANVQCIGQVDNLFITNGVVKCREDFEADDETILLHIGYKALTLKEEATMVSKGAERCDAIADKFLRRQIQKDIVIYQNCILKNTLTTTQIVYP